MMRQQRVESLAQLNVLAEEIAAEGGSRFLILLDGEMGAGKTQFTKLLLHAIGSDETVSPSFAIHNSYETPRGEVHHFDLFRLESIDDLESTGFWELFGLDEAWIVVEWSDKIDEFGLRKQMPKNWPTIHMKFEIDPSNPQARVVEVTRPS